MREAKLSKSFKKTFNENRLFYFVGLILALFICTLAIWQIAITKPSKVDWLNQSDWTHFAGAEKTDNGIKISPTGRVINHRDTSTAQPNPPVNVRGSHLRISGDFQIDMELSGVNNEATVQFYGEVPVIYDEWRQERPSIRLIAKNDGLYAAIWDGTSATSMDERFYSIDLKNEASLSLVRSKGNFIIKIDGKILGTMPDHSVFMSGKIWIGADAKLGTDGWTLTSLTAKSLDKKPLELASPPALIGNRDDPNTLHNLSMKNSRKLLIGAAVSIGPLLTDNQYRSVALSQFSMITPENTFKPQVIHPQEDLYLFKDSDTFVEAAEKNQMIVHGHSLVMGKANPEWMQKNPEEKRKQIMVDHISKIVGHYKGRVAQWDVVNEPLSEDDVDYEVGLKGMRKQMWFDALGEEYIDIAFKTAHEADPKAKLYLNDFGIENNGKRWDAFLSLITRLKARGVPIDGVGFEAHVYHTPADTINLAELKQHIQILASLGIESRISEIDVLGDDPSKQAKQYADVLQVCLSEPSCKSYGVWGITDLYGSTALSDRYPIIPGDSLLWDTYYKPKPALESLRAVLKQQP